MSMTENKALESALEKVKAQKVNFGFLERFDVDENWEVMKALEEIQEYRVIGTVESLKNLPAICDSLAESGMKAEKLIEELKAYRAIGTIDEFKALKEKNEPKELTEHNFQDEVHHYLCPSCRSIVSCNQNYCDECGQALET